VRQPLLFIAIIVSLICWGCARKQRLNATQVSTRANPSLAERIASQFAAASPLADPGDAGARDAAASRLAGCREFRLAAGSRILWGGFNPAKGYDPEKYSLTEFDPLVWLKLYASVIMFTGEYELRTSGRYSVLEMKAKFRSGLDPGDYPYPFWHSPKKWQGYVNLSSLILVFEADHLTAAYRCEKIDAVAPAAKRAWDGNWRWKDAVGNEQPRVALFSYLFGPDNPHGATVNQAYRELEERFRTQNCHACHAPDNREKCQELFLLNYPNQSLVGRHKLVHILNENKMPPSETGHPAGIADGAVRAELIRLARSFAAAGDAAMAYESSRDASTRPNLE